MLKYKIEKIIDSCDWDNLVSSTYNKQYCLQQQDGCQSRGHIRITIPEKYDNDYENDSIPEIINGDEMGVSFKSWLERKDPFFNESWEDNLFWERNFYPDLQTIANNLYKKRLIEKGEYLINIDW